MDESDIEGSVPLEILFYDIGSQAGNNGSPVQATTDEDTAVEVNLSAEEYLVKFYL